MNREELIETHNELVSQGWRRRFSAQEPRLSEMKELYESLGLEVMILDGGVPDDGQECTGCFDLEGLNDMYKTIYTRGEAKDGAGADELYN